METLKRSVAPFLLSRVIILTLLIVPLCLSIQPIPTTSDAGMMFHLQPATPDRTSQRLGTLLRSGDATWYLGIANDGYYPLPGNQRTIPGIYTAEQRNWAFFPLYPILEKTLSPIFGSTFNAGLVLSYLLFFCSIGLLRKLAENSALSAGTADRTIWLLCLFPFSYFFSFPLTESLFLFLSVAAFLLIELKRPVMSGWIMALASATRPTGLLLIPGYAFEILRKKRAAAPKSYIDYWPELLGIALSPIGAILYALYLWKLTGTPLAFALNQEAWGRQPISILGLFRSLSSPFETISAPWNMVLLNTAAGYLSIACAVWALCKKRYGWALLILVPLISSLGTGISQSYGRFTAVSFPVFLILGEISRRPEIERIILIIFAALLGVLTVARALYVTSVMC
jgi:hypothetical protein